MNSEKILFENIFSVFEAVDIGIWVWDIDTNKIGWSRHAYTMFGYESYSFDVSFDVWANMVHPKDLDNVVKVMMNQLENRASFSVEFRLRCKDGSYKWIDGRGKATKYDSNGRFIRVVGTYTDITEKKRLEQFAENKLRLLEDAEKISHIGSWELDIKNNKLYWSDETYRIFELDKEQFGASYEFFVSTVHPEDRTKVNDVYWKSVENKEPYYVEHRLLMPDGRIKYVIERGRTFYDEDGKPERSVGTVQDITEKVLLDEALKRQKEIFKAIFDKANVGICLTDREGKIIIFNSYISDLLGYTREELEGKYIEDITFQGDFEKEKILIKDILEGKRGSFRLEKRYIKKDGSLIWGDLSVALINDKNGKVENIIGVVIDINDKKLLETELIVAKELADQSNQQKSIFLATMSHEIRTPLNGIIGIAQLLQMENLPPHIVEYVKHLNNASTHLYDLINDILDFSKIEAGEFDIKLEEFSVKGLLESVIALFTQRIKEKRLDFFAIINPEIPNILYGDPYRIKQIFTNLISNAIKFTEKGKVVVELDIKQKKDKEINLSFKVSDTGIGMNQEELHLLYQPFKQADSGITRKFGGTGLGLSIVKKIIDKLGWEISVSSEKGKGTTFDVTIPLNLIEGGNVGSTSSLTGYDITVLSRDKDYAELIERSLSYYRVNTKFVEIRDGNYQDIVSDTIILDLDRENKDFFLKMMEHCHVSNFIVCIKDIYSDLKEFFKTKENVKIIYNPIYPFDIYRYLYDINGDEQCEIENRLNDLTLDKGFSNIKALIVDDNYINQNIFKTMLGRLGIDSDLASDGRVALKKIEDTMYDIIFMDIQMPGQDGYEVTRLIRANERYKNIPIIAVTAHAFKEDVEKALNSGMNDHIAKPLKFDTLVKTISKWINLETKIVIPGEVKDNINIPYLDLKELSSRGLNFSDVKPLIEIFVNEVNKELNTVEKYLEDNNINELQKIIHKFKGTSGNLCLTDIYINLSKIDNKLKNNVEPKSIKNLFDIFFEQILVLRHFLLIENENGKNNEESFGEQELTVKDIEYIKELINKRNMTVIDEINKFINQLKRIDLELSENIIMDINYLNFKEAYEKLSIILEKINGEKR